MSLFRLESHSRAGVRTADGDPFFTRYGAFRLHDDRAGFERTDWAALGGVGVAKVVGSGHDVEVEEEECLSLILPFRGRVRSAVSGGREVGVEAGGALLIAPGPRKTRVERRGMADYRAAAIRLRPEALDAAAARLAGRPARQRRDWGAALALAPERTGCVAGLARHVASLLAELERPDSLLARPRAAESAARHLAHLLVETLEAAGALPAPDRPAAADARRVRLAEAHIRADYASIASVEEIARAAGVGVRALQIAFQTMRGETPLAALTAVRLEAARGRLADPRAETTVSGAALECGFTHLGRFSLAYRARFGEPPSETLRRARGDG